MEFLVFLAETVSDLLLSFPSLAGSLSCCTPSTPPSLLCVKPVLAVCPSRPVLSCPALYRTLRLCSARLTFCVPGFQNRLVGQHRPLPVMWCTALKGPSASLVCVFPVNQVWSEEHRDVFGDCSRDKGAPSSLEHLSQEPQDDLMSCSTDAVIVLQLSLLPDVDGITSAGRKEAIHGFQMILLAGTRRIPGRRGQKRLQSSVGLWEEPRPVGGASLSGRSLRQHPTSIT